MSCHLRLVVLALGIAACSRTQPTATTATAPTSTTKTMPEFVVPSRGASAPFSGVVKAGNLLFVSGQIGSDSTGRMSNSTSVQTTEAMKKISRLLAQAGSSLDRVAKCTVMMAKMDEWSAMNSAYNAFFPGTKPARSSFGTNGLAQGALVEIECIATVD